MVSAFAALVQQTDRSTGVRRTLNLTFILYVFRFLGIFRLTRFLYRNRLMILAYHGAELDDEASFRPKLFIRRETVERRLRFLRRKRFNVVSLQDGLRLLREGALPRNSIVVTVDDGWYSTLQILHPAFVEAGINYTLYLTTYFVEKGGPVTNVAMSYLLWKTRRRDKVPAAELGLGVKAKQYDFSLSSERQACEEDLLACLETLDFEDGRALLARVAEALRVDLNEINRRRAFDLMHPEEITSLVRDGVDIELHTHRHRIPVGDAPGFASELGENRKQVIRIAKTEPKHFCYPSGIHYPSCEKILADAGVSSATTCDPGFVTETTNPFYLPRFLDSESVRQIEFEAEVCGLKQTARSLLFRGND